MRTYLRSARKLLFRFVVKRNQWLWKKKISHPYLSPDLFISLCDFAYLKNIELDDIEISRLRKANSIFCQSDLLEEFLGVFSDFVSAKILVCGNSDRDFTEIPMGIPESIKALFLQNSFVSDNQYIFTLPIGLENLSLGINGNPRLLRKPRVKPADREKVIAGPYSPTHISREIFSSEYPDSEEQMIVFKNKLFPEQYSRIVSSFKFVLALRGNGIDTHRFWETLYRGSVPVVQVSTWSRSIANLGIPFVEVPNLQYETIKKSVQEWGLKEIDPLKIDPLWEDFWINLFDSFIQSHGHSGGNS